MRRALGIAKTIGSLLAIELFVPGGTLIVLALLLTGGPGSPLFQALERRCPGLVRTLSRLASSPRLTANALAHKCAGLDRLDLAVWRGRREMDELYKNFPIRDQDVERQNHRYLTPHHRSSRFSGLDPKAREALVSP